MLGAPRLVEAMARDGVIPKVFGLRYGPAKEPAVALLITAVLVLCVILTGDLNLLAPLVTAIFLLTFCLLNIVCVSMTCSSPGGNSPKRIKFSCYSPWTALLGAISSLAAMIFCATAEALVIMAVVGCIVCALNWRGLTAWCRNTSSRASPRSANAKRGSLNDLTSLEDGGISEAIIKPVPSASIAKVASMGGESSNSDAADAEAENIDSEQLTPEQRSRKQASDEAMIKLMSIVHAQSEAEQQPHNAWVRAWFPCVKAKKRPRRQTSRPLESPLLFNEHEGSVNGHAGEAEVDGADGIDETDDEAYIRLHGRYITLAASRVRDAIAYKYRSSDWGSMRKLSAKRFFHQTKFFRSLVMVLWFLLAFVEVPSWCFQVWVMLVDLGTRALLRMPGFIAYLRNVIHVLPTATILPI